MNDFEIIHRRMSAGLGNFRFQLPMPSFQCRKMRFYRHAVLPSQVEGRLRPGLGAEREPQVCHS